MRNFRMRRAWAVVATVALAAAMLPVLLAGTASAATTVSTESEFWDAWTDGSVTQIDLAASIDLHSGNGNGTCEENTLPDRNPSGPTLVDGHGFTLRQLCSPNTVLFTFGSQPLTVQNITITHGGGAEGTGVFNYGGDVTVIDSTITGNHSGDNLCEASESVHAAYLCSSWGGGVYAGGAATITNSVITHNSADASTALGGGIFSDGPLIVTGSTVSGNEANGQGNAYGGGAFTWDGATIDTSTFSDNVATCPGECSPGGGGLASQGGDATVTSSNFVGNTAECERYCDNVGGGILAGSGSLTVTGSLVSQNQASCQDSCQADGGGIFAESGWFFDSVTGASSTKDVQAAGRGYLATVTDSTVSNNSAVVTDTPGGDCDCSGAGAVINGHESLTVTRSTFSNNYAIYDGGALDIWSEITQVRIENSTITGNQSSYDGAVDAWDSAVTTVYSTIDGNVLNDPPLQGTAASSSSYGHGDVRAAGDLPRPANLSAGSLSTFATVFADPLGGPNCVITGESEIANSEGWNFSDDASCGLTNTTDGDRENAGSPKLNVLADNGGPTATMLPYTPKSNGEASPLIDAIPVASCQAGPADGVGTDQRGVTRPQLQGCDIGAVEVTGEEYQIAGEVVIQPRFTG